MLLVFKNKILHSRLGTDSKDCYHSLKILATKRTPEELRKRRQRSARNKITGTPERPRLCVHRSNNHIYVQVIDDTKMHTLVASGTISPALRERAHKNNIHSAQIVGKDIAKLCIEK